MTSVRFCLRNDHNSACRSQAYCTQSGRVGSKLLDRASCGQPNRHSPLMLQQGATFYIGEVQRIRGANWNAGRNGWVLGIIK